MINITFYLEMAEKEARNDKQNKRERGDEECNRCSEVGHAPDDCPTKNRRGRRGSGRGRGGRRGRCQGRGREPSNHKYFYNGVKTSSVRKSKKNNSKKIKIF
ncbi:nucleolar protein 10-like [Xenia sp. Carnegie-2017]|uniref:nucleolar protein 10-like n=1 Tax=Xenia sp. Carnegie-2017 TaxID=2897299 RepID=UPI001F034836|nr:nucleolar protein 10-like [Xenia sp. Carnegie-2017]